MQRRIFIGISLPENVKKRIRQKIEKWQELPIKWKKDEDFHVTLSFLGFVEDSALPDVCKAVKNAVSERESFEIAFEKIELGPNIEKPNLVWLIGEASEELKKLQEEIEKSLDIFISEKKVFRPHITLGRISKYKWETLPEIPKIEESFKISIPVENVEIFESRMEKRKRRYDILEVCPLK
jgi:2'-5' RNA ligase